MKKFQFFQQFDENVRNIDGESLYHDECVQTTLKRNVIDGNSPKKKVVLNGEIILWISFQ